MSFDAFIARWSASGGAERANKDSFLNELCDALGVERPHPKTGDPKQDLYVFEKDVPKTKAGSATTGFVDLYKHGAFLLEAKQGATQGPKRRDTPAWNQLMSEAHGQALGYVSQLDEPPPFLVVCDVGYCFDLYASFDGSGAHRAFPDGHRKRLFLRDLDRHANLLRALWTDPLSLDPARHSAAVTREIAAQIAELSRALEAAGHPPERVAKFLMRCLFTMFAEDVGLLPEKVFSQFLETYWIPSPPSFPGGVGSLWRAMDKGEDYIVGRLRKFNGGLFSEHDALPLTREQLSLLLVAAKSDWSKVDPSIFGTLLERALNPRERHALGAHYTPRAYVERLIKPTIEEPLRADWDLVRAEVRELVEAGKVPQAQARVLEFHHTLCATRVLDPACGTGNFLYVALDLFKRLESEVLASLTELGYTQIGLEMERYRVTPEQFLGIEVKPWAKEIAELVLWIGYLQWQVGQPGGANAVPEPVLQDFGNIECRDAVLAYGAEELLLDEKGKPVTRWDGETKKTSPITGEEIPDEAAQVPVYRYVNPRKAEWPKTDFVVGNPPYIGNKKMRLALGDGYVKALRQAYTKIPETVDFVMYWWRKASELTEHGEVRRFGLITTNSISQTFNRRVVESALEESGSLSLQFAIADHPWVDSSDGAAVRVAMTVGGRDGKPGLLRSVVVEHGEASGGRGAVSLVFRDHLGKINADLTCGVDLGSSVQLQANEGLSFMGVTLVGEGFRLSMDEVRALGFDPQGLPATLRRYVNGKALAQGGDPRFVIDFFGHSEEEARKGYPSLYQHLLSRVRPERLQNPRLAYRLNWWIFGEPRSNMRRALTGLTVFIAICRTAKHLVFQFVPSAVIVESKVVAIAVADAATLGVLSSRIHNVWGVARASRHGVGNDLTYNNTVCFETFPFPEASDLPKSRIRALGETLDAHRKRQQALHPKLTITGMYNVLEKLRSGEPLDEKDRLIHEQGLVSILKQIHDDLDAAVFEAYGWPTTLTDEEILERLVALNHERAEEEKRGLIRWLRPEFQSPQGVRAETQASLTEAGLEVPDEAEAAAEKAGKGKKGAKATKAAWPKDLPARVVAVRDLLAEQGEARAADLTSRFKGVKAEEGAKLLESLAAVGVALETTPGAGTPQGPAPGAERTWALVR